MPPPSSHVLALPEPYRRERVIRIFLNRESVIRLLGAALMERHEQWTTGHRYFDMAAYWQWRQARDAASTPRDVTADGVREGANNLPE